MLSQTSEYALRAILYLARQTTTSPVSAEAIAEALGAPRNYLAKTLNTLAKRGFVRSTRGPFGGFRLAVDPASLTIASVVRAVEGPRERGICLVGGRPCNEAQPCTVHSRWKAVAAQMRAPLNDTTIGDLVEGEVPNRIPVGVKAGALGLAALAVGPS